MHRDVRLELALQIGALDGSSEKNPRLALGPVQLGRHDEFRFRERLRFGKAGSAAVRQQVSSRRIARTADAVRVGERNQKTGEILRPGCRIRATQDAPPVRGTARRLAQCPGVDGQAGRQRGGRRSRATRQDAHAQPQIHIACARSGAQQVALAQDRRKVAGEARHAEFAPLGEHVREPRMRAEARQLTAVSRDEVVLVDRLQ